MKVDGWPKAKPPIGWGDQIWASLANQIQGSEGPTGKGGGKEDISSRGYRSLASKASPPRSWDVTH